MGVLGSILGLAIIGGPCLLAGWIGCRLRRPLLAFVAAWVLTPVLTVAAVLLMLPVLRAVASPNNDGTWAIMIPICSIGTGLVTGVITAAICARRRSPATEAAEKASTVTAEPGAAADRGGM